jgi:hypothetical protein
MSKCRVDLSYQPEVGIHVSYYRTDDFTETYLQICPSDMLTTEFNLRILNWIRDGIAPYTKL